MDGEHPGYILASSMGEGRVSYQVLKADAALGVLFGFGIVCKKRNPATGALEQYYDDGSESAPDFSEGISEHEMLKASADFMAAERAIEVEHRGPIVGGTVLFAFPLTEEIAKALGIKSDQTGLLVGVRPSDPEVVQKALRGELRGFSIFGGAVPVEVAA